MGGGDKGNNGPSIRGNNMIFKLSFLSNFFKIVQTSFLKLRTNIIFFLNTHKTVFFQSLQSFLHIDRNPPSPSKRDWEVFSSPYLL